MNINILTIPHSEQRYDTVGDWWFEEEASALSLQIRVSDMGNPTYEWLVAEHEINEAIMCKDRGISEKSVSDFDIAFEKIREAHPEIIGMQEPGNMISAPYFEQHQRATSIEQHSAAVHNVLWKDYSTAVESL